jgi:hypothetical protein
LYVDGTILSADWRDWKKQWKLQEIGVTAKIQTQHLLNTSLECYSYVNPGLLLKQCMRMWARVEAARLRWTTLSSGMWHCVVSV